MPSVVVRGRVHLQPLVASCCSQSLSVDLDLARDDGRLTLGDLRRAAERQEALGRFESAHRLWTAVGRAAAEIDDEVLWDHADRRAAEAIEAAARRITAEYRRSGVRHDYDTLARARAAGQSWSQVALTHGCSVSTVRRAVEFCHRRDELLAQHPDLIDALVEGGDADRLAEHYGAEANVLRWMLASGFDRRMSTHA